MIHDARYGGGRGGDFWDARTRAHTHTHTHADTRARALTHTYNWQHTLSPAQRPRLLARLRMGGGGREGGKRCRMECISRSRYMPLPISRRPRDAPRLVLFGWLSSGVQHHVRKEDAIVPLWRRLPSLFYCKKKKLYILKRHCKTPETDQRYTVGFTNGVFHHLFWYRRAPPKQQTQKNVHTGRKSTKLVVFLDPGNNRQKLWSATHATGIKLATPFLSHRCCVTHVRCGWNLGGMYSE